MPSIVSFDVGAAHGEVPPVRAPLSAGVSGAFHLVAAPDLEGLMSSAANADAACIIFGLDPEASLAVVRRLRAAAPDLAIVAVEAPSPEVALAAAAAGAHETTPEGADHRLVTLALRRATEYTSAQRELRSLRAQQPVGASTSALTGPFGDAHTVQPLREIEREAIRHALAATGGRVGQAAKMLGMGRATLYRRLATFDVVRTA